MTSWILLGSWNGPLFCAKVPQCSRAINQGLRTTLWAFLSLPDEDEMRA